MPDINLLNTELAELQRQVLSMDNAIQPDRAQLIHTIQKSHDLLIAIMQVSKHGKVLENFFNLITQATEELYRVAQVTTDKPLITRPKAFLQQLAVTYQESMVPMLTRLHNLANDSDDMLKITSIASLGNEVITCSSQIYQYSDKLDVTETMHAILGIVLMFAGIGLIIAILSNSAPGIQLMDAITLIAISYTLCKVAIKNHIKVPEADLTIRSIDNVALALAKIVNALPVKLQIGRAHV